MIPMVRLHEQLGVSPNQRAIFAQGRKGLKL
jgi:hypothetical protein